MPVKAKQRDELRTLMNVGPAMRADFKLLGINTIAQLAKQKPDALYAKLNAITGTRHDPCVWDTFAATIHQAKTGEGNCRSRVGVSTTGNSFSRGSVSLTARAIVDCKPINVQPSIESRCIVFMACSSLPGYAICGYVKPMKWTALTTMCVAIAASTRRTNAYAVAYPNPATVARIM